MNKFLIVEATVIGFCNIALGAPGEPNPALKSVAHDATLTGDGTLAAPLGVLNSNGGVHVVDSIGQSVGPLIVNSIIPPTTFALRQINNSSLLLGLGADGFARPLTFVFYHTSSDCT